MSNKLKLSKRENLLRVLRHETPEWVPCTPHIANLNNLPGQLPQHLLNEPIDRLSVSRFIGGDLLFQINPITYKNNGSVKRIQKKDADDIVIDQIITPIGELNSKIKYSKINTPNYNNTKRSWGYPPSLVTESRIEYFIKDMSDYKILRYYFENINFEIINKAEIDKLLKEVGEDGVLVLEAPSSPHYELFNEYAGLERIVFDSFDNESELQMTIDVMAERYYELYERLSKTNAQVIRMTEDLDTSNTSPELFIKLSEPVITRYTDICHSNNKILLLHMCGHIKDLLQSIKNTGVDAVHCLCPPMTGNTPVKLARGIFKDKICIMARVDPPVLLRGSQEELEQTVINMLAEVVPADNFILILPCGRASFNNIQTVINTINKHGKYPVYIK